MLNERFIKLFETASRDSTPINERLVAMNKMRELSARHGGIESFFQGEAASVAFTPYQPYAGLRQEVSDLQTQIARLDGQVIDLLKTIRLREKEIETLKARSTVNSEIAADGTMSYHDFAAEVRKRLVHADRNWQIAFEEQTGLKRSRFAKFNMLGRVTMPEYVKALDTLVAVTTRDRHSAPWSISEVNLVRKLTEDGLSERQIAEQLTQDLGRRITENMLKRLKHNSRQRRGEFRDAAYGPPIGSSR